VKTLRQRLTLTYMLVAFLTVLIGAVLSGGLLIQAYNQLARQSAWSIQRLAVDRLQGYYRQHGTWRGIAPELQEASENLAAQPFLPPQRLVLADESGRVVFDSLNQLEGRPLPLRLRPEAAPVRVDGREVGFLSVPHGAGLLAVFRENNFLSRMLRIILVGGAVSGGIALLVGLLIARHVTRPLLALTRAAQHLAAGARHEPLRIPADAELAELATAFNTMAANLDRQETLRRQLVADIAHELRTPLSVLRLQIEALEDGVTQPTPETLGSLHQEVTLLSRLIDDLRLLSLADAGQLSLSPEALDVAHVLARAAAAVAPRAQQQGLALRVEDDVASNGSSPVLVWADAQRLAQILGNLLENALRYTPSGGTIVLRSAALPNQRVLLEVADDGPGIAPDDLPHLFDRFYRTSRARDRESGGSGLGLSIVQRLVEAHGGTVTVDSTPGQGTTFRIVLPAVAPAVLRAP
jgi:signal transduction histidine kinase